MVVLACRGKQKPADINTTCYIHAGTTQSLKTDTLRKVLASHADVLRLVMHSSPREECVTSLRMSAWEAGKVPTQYKCLSTRFGPYGKKIF